MKGRYGRRTSPDPSGKGSHRPHDIFQLLRAEIVARGRRSYRPRRVNTAGAANSSGFGESFRLRRKIDPVPEDVAVCKDDFRIRQKRYKFGSRTR